ncbi:MAG: flagellar hook assembly protein FlgD [Rhodospirillaceae bacterium]|nr:flagellar hook assembly protein FlgD [Rhodospirillaceae bacterium]
MAITSVAGADTANPVLSKTEASRTKLAKDLDSFLVLLTSQLKNQDPLSPMDSTEFTNQLVQFAQVEQQINANDNLTSMIELTQQSIITSSVNYIGKSIEALSSQVPLQNGKAKLAYGVDKDAQNVTVVIRNDAGDIVYSTPGEKTKGVHPLEWDGKDTYGIQQPDGIYTVQVTALSAKNEPIDTWSTAFGKVTGVTNTDGKTLLVMGTLGVPIDEVLSVTDS